MRTMAFAGIVATAGATAVVLLSGCNSTLDTTENPTRVATVESATVVTAHAPLELTVTIAQIPQSPRVPISSDTLAAPASAPGIATQNVMLTPGLADPAVTQADVQTTICVTGYTATVRNVTAVTKAKVYGEYGITTPTTGAYEIDHLIPLELGGSNDIGNLWPEAATGTDDSHTKDTWENTLHSEVCAGTVTLPVAQDEMVHWWVLLGAVANPTPVTSSAAPVTSSAAPVISVPSPPSAPTPSSGPVDQTDQSTAGDAAPGASSAAIKPGAFCDLVGAQGMYNGANYVCSTTSAAGVAYKGDRAHWRRG